MLNPPHTETTTMQKPATTDHLSHACLNKKQEDMKDNFSESVSLRVHRAISWLGRAEIETDDDDACFIFLWIAFNAAYADEDDLQSAPTKTRIKGFFRKIVALDANQRVYNAIWSNFSGPVRVLLGNKYVFDSFWRHLNGKLDRDNWEKKFTKEAKKCMKALENKRTVDVLRLLFDRLYVLRNQIMHGGATWNSSVNRTQVKDGTKILRFLVPEFIDIMMENPQEDWGRPSYPVIKEDH